MKIVMIAGEVSGDLLGGKLALELYKTNEVTEISGIGGETMRQANVNNLFDVSETSVVGIIEVLKHYPRLQKILADVKEFINKTHPDLIILIDYPEFNLKLAKYAKSLNIKVLFYVSPQVWAWRTGRVKNIKACVDLMAVLFPFELEFYEKENIPVCLVKHPLLDDIDMHIPEPISNNNILTIGLAPGSRENEIKKLYPVMLDAASLLAQRYDDLKFIVPVAPGVNEKSLKKMNTNNLTINYFKDNFYDAIAQCDVVAISSGTATLQTALMGKAMVVIYKISPITYRLFGHMIKVDHICLANIILGRRAYPELVQNKANAEDLYNELTTLIENDHMAADMKTNRQHIYENLNLGINSKQLAQKAISLAKQS